MNLGEGISGSQGGATAVKKFTEPTQSSDVSAAEKLLFAGITGKENQDELREKVVQLATNCSGNVEHECPFRMLRGLAYDTLKNSVDRMSHLDLLGLFRFDCECLKERTADPQPFHPPAKEKLWRRIGNVTLSLFIGGWIIFSVCAVVFVLTRILAAWWFR
jgi:hypothetical protein